MKSVYSDDKEYYINSDMHSTYNLADSSMLRETAISGYISFRDGYYIPVTPGKILLCNRYKGRFVFFDELKTEISFNSYVDTFTPVVVPENAAYMRMSYNAKHTSYGANILIYYSENAVSPTDDRREFIPNKLMDGGIIDNKIYDTTFPDDPTSEFMNVIKYNVMRDIRKEENIIRIGCFNIFISRLYSGWPTIKKELKDHAIDICGFEEVRYGAVLGTVERRLPEYLKSWQFPYGSYHDPGVQMSSNKALSSHWEVISTNEYIYPSNADGSFIKCVIKLPHYRDSRDGAGIIRGPIDITLSVYVYHATSSKGVSARLAEIADILAVIASDDSDFKVVVGDTNAFENGMLDGRTQEWDAWVAGGLIPVYQDRRINTVNSVYGICPYDNIMMGENITCKTFNVVPSANYPIDENGTPVSDHDLFYADLIFDFDAVINKKIAQAAESVEGT